MPLIFPWNPHEVAELCWHHHGQLYRFPLTAASTQTALCRVVCWFRHLGGRRGRGEAEEWQLRRCQETLEDQPYMVFSLKSHRTKWWISSQPCLIAGIPKWQFEWRNLDKIMSHGKFGVPNWDQIPLSRYIWSPIWRVPIMGVPQIIHHIRPY